MFLKKSSTSVFLVLAIALLQTPLLCAQSTASNPAIDSLQKLVAASKEDTVKVNLMNLIANKYEDMGAYDRVIAQYMLSVELAKKLKSINHQVFIESQMAFIKIKQGKYDEAEPILRSALKEALAGNYQRGQAQCLRFIGVIYLYKGEYEKATEYYLKAQKVWESMNSPKGLAIGYGDLGIVQYYRKNYAKTAEYWEKELEIDKAEHLKSLSSDYNNLGLVYIELSNYSKAEECFKRSIELNKKDNRYEALTDNLNNLGKLEYTRGNIDKAIDYMKQANEEKELLGNKSYLASGYSNIGELYRKKKDFKNALAYSKKAMAILEKADDIALLSTNYVNISAIYADMHDFENAYTYSTMYANLKDTLLNNENSKQMNELEKKYDTEKKDNEIKLLNKDKELQLTEIQKQQTQRNGFIIGFILALLLVVFVFRGYKAKQNANKLLAEKNNLIEVQKRIVEEKNKDITDSINYAKRIQTAMLPTNAEIQKYLPESFVLYKPKDIVSGDFYWFNQKNGYVFVAAADCTGHGVPGAFMSMIGNDILSHLVISKSITDTNVILTQLHEGIKDSLKQNEEQSQTKDGMDIAIVRIKMDADSVSLTYSGALRPLWLVKSNSNEIIEYKANKFSIGGAYSSEHRIFTQHSIDISKGDTIYLTTDGYIDQFGGEKGKKFKNKKLQEKLLTIQNLPMDEQKKNLDQTFETWRGDLEQVDDVLIIGIRF